jgi:hypothetical protein
MKKQENVFMKKIARMSTKMPNENRKSNLEKKKTISICI